MKRKHLNRSNCQCRASEVNLHITQSSSAPRQPWSVLVDLTFMSSGRAKISFFLSLIVARLNCLPLALIRQKREKVIKLNHPSLSKFLINFPCHVNHTGEACVLYLGRAREKGKTIQEYVFKCTCKSRSGSVLKICPKKMIFVGSRLACVEEKDTV